MLKKIILSLSLVLASPVFADEVEIADKADNGFMMICTALVLFMSVPGIAFFYGGLLRSKNVLSMLSQVLVTFSLIAVLWITYGYSLAFGEGNWFFGNFEQFLLVNVGITDISGSIYELIWIAFQGSFACITCCLILGAFAERVRFSAVLIFMVLWFTFSYIPMAHMVWGGGILGDEGALDFAGGTVVHINAAVAGLLGAYMLKSRIGYNREPLKPFNLPYVYLGAAILYIGWFGFNAGSSTHADEIAGLAFINTVAATAAAVLAWTIAEWILRGKPSCLGAASGVIAGLVGVTPAAGFVGVGGAMLIGLACGFAGVWGVSSLKRVLKVDDTCDVFGVHGVCGIVGCILTGVFTSESLGGIGFAEGVTMASQVGIQLMSVITCVIWTAIIAFIAYKIADITVGLRVSEEYEREGLDINSHGESAFNS
ncbi:MULTISPECIES: ammonium transporter AmtB [unclassified Gilliamella]|uniref:ammonium transporter AmtB n=1 Tax=unclassified Gilliamella TaxID=2685620 RepID=UPI0008107A38|nr:MULTISPECIES: ammonium transporter AmtB [Gilliamella]MCX8585048.1 ammonium transporter AmtB [Gilliamella sp. B3562]MCX8596183.1 ammonium transporter AmtB [Gilliamella sp. B3493]MCX8598379.1 ammonium transporter AmtB [Gilliamella sp. B3486]MCX8662899.1 ammonium transporter AmtB [Gilliamella sp. B2911]MCX8670018.1 ammonium transporter AmtB [Gilliamella sp. B2785]